MGQTQSFMTDVHEVNTVDQTSLCRAMSDLLAESRISSKYRRDLDCNEIAKNALQFLEETVQEDYKERKPFEKLENVKDNSEVLILMEDIGQVTIRSGQGGHRIIVLINIAGYQSLLVEHSIKTPKITGTFLHSLDHITKSTNLRNHLRIEPRVMSSVLQFVQDNSEFDWKNACINFQGVYPLKIKSGNGSCEFDIHQILENIQTGCVDQQEFIHRNKPLNLLRKPKFRNSFIQGKQLETGECHLTHNTKHVRQEQHTETGLEQMVDSLKIVQMQKAEIRERNLWQEFQKMDHERRQLEDQYKKKKSNFDEIKRDLNELKEQLRNKTQQFNAAMKALSMTKEECTQKKLFEDEQGNFNEKSLGRKDANLQFPKAFKLDKFDARQLGKLRVKLCGNEGAPKNKLQLGLEKQLVDLTDYFKKHESEKYWQNSTIQIFNENDSYSIEIGKGKHSILITSIQGKTKIKKI